MLFKNLKVVELASVLAGPSVGMFFAELGANVVKVENKKAGGDVTRNWRLANEDKTRPSAYFFSVNYNKKHLLLDYSNPEDFKQVIEFLKEADIVICNFKHGLAERFKLTFEDVKTINPTVIYGQISGFKSNPERVAYDVVLQAESGYMFMNGQLASPPTKMPLALMDILAAHQMKEGILVALLERERTGKAIQVNTSLEEAAIASLANQATNWLMNNHIPQRIGSLHPNIAPYGEVFDTKDGAKIVLAVGSDKQFKELLNVLQLNELIGDKRFYSNELRVLNRSELHQLLSNQFKHINSDEFIEKCIQNDIPAGKVRNMKEVFQNPVAQEMILEENKDNILSKRVKTIAFTLEN